MRRSNTLNADVDYYRVLEVAPDASVAEIRASFKRLILQYHPDKNPGRSDGSEQRVRDLIQAFDILGNPTKRREFDRIRGAILRRAGRSGAEVSRPYYFRRRDAESRALQVLYLLLHGKPREAWDLLADLERRWGQDFLRRNLDRSDYVDCLFLLGEHCIERKDYLAAARRLEAIYVRESHERYPRQYLSQVVDLLKDLYLRKLPRCAPPDVALCGLEDSVCLGLSRAEESLRVRKTVELLVGEGRLGEARETLDGLGDGVLSAAETSELRRQVQAAECA